MHASVGIVSTDICPQTGHVSWLVIFKSMLVLTVIAAEEPAEAAPEAAALPARNLQRPDGETRRGLAAHVADASTAEAAVGLLRPR